MGRPVDNRVVANGNRNAFEQLGRMRKVAAILAVIPIGRTREANLRTAAWLAELEQTDRDRLAAHAGQKSPSEDTWREVCAAARMRRMAS